MVGSNKEELAQIVGRANILEDHETLEAYSQASTLYILEYRAQ